tara:strand:- start:2166 stop:2696 length:531 start_codon:yes stop_codon:yes gene_type:complete
MFIHKSFSVSELIDIVEIFEMDIPDYKDFYKKGLIFYIELYLQNNRPINFNNNYFNFKNHYDLVNYLNQPNKRLKLSIEKKKEINITAKKILKYCKDYRNDNFNDMFKLTSSISDYADLPSVRKAIIAINRYPNKPYTITYSNSIFYIKNVKERKYLKNKFDNFKINKKYSCINLT